MQTINKSGYTSPTPIMELHRMPISGGFQKFIRNVKKNSIAYNRTLFGQRFWHYFLFSLGCFFSVAVLQGEPVIRPDRVVVVANQSERRSVDLARYYMEKRNIPEENLIALPFPEEETLSGRDFVSQVWDPLQETLMEKNWISGSFRQGRDEFTRRNVLITGNRIDAMVLCKGVPLRIKHEDIFFRDSDSRRLPEPFHTTRASVDSELALLAFGGHRMGGPVNNPAFQRDNPPAFSTDRIIRVTRLDGPTYADARKLVDSALEGEKKGLRGRAYVDIGGPHPSGDAWLEAVVELLEKTSYDLDIDRKNRVFSAEDRFDAPVIYFGWYTRSLAGAWRQVISSAPPGAIAFHIHSFSATTLRNPNSGWSGPLVARGVAATVGNVYEPYLEGTHNPVLFLDTLLKGKSLAEAGLRSNRFFSWQTIVLGDPLYRPFATDLEEQLQHLTPLDGYAQYAVIRKMNELEVTEDRLAAARYGQRMFNETPGIALALRTATLLKEEGELEDAKRILTPILQMRNFALDQVIVARNVARLADSLGQTTEARQLLEALRSQNSLPEALQKAL